MLKASCHLVILSAFLLANAPFAKAGTERRAQWQHDSFCNCPGDDYVSERIAYKEVPMWGKTGEGWLKEGGGGGKG